MNANCAPSEMTRRSPLSGAGLADQFVNILSLLAASVNGAEQLRRSEVSEDRERPFSQKIVNMIAKRIPSCCARVQRLSETPYWIMLWTIPVAIARQNASVAQTQISRRFKGTTQVSLS